MAGLQLSGLASGLDWRSLVDNLMSAERAPINKLQTEKGMNIQRNSAFDALKSNLTALQNAMKALSSETTDVFGDRSAKISGTSTWTASAAAGALAGTYQVNVSQLATRSARSAATSAGASLSPTSDVSGVSIATLPVGTTITAGDFTINGAKVNVALTDSLQDVFDKIGTATGGAVTASYDPASDRVKLQGTGEIVLGAANDTSNFLPALSLSNNGTDVIIPPKALGTVSLGTAIAKANLKNAVAGTDASGNGSFSINGVAINYNVNTDSLSTIMGRINSSTAGVTATYDKLTDRFTLTNKTTGDVGLAISEAPGGLLSSLGLDATAGLTRGQNAQFSIDGGPTLTSTSNTFDESVTGLTGISITATSQTSQSITVSSETGAVRGKIDEFIKQYNAVQSYIEQQTKTTTGANGSVTSAIFASNREISDISKSLRNQIFKEVPGLAGTMQRLESLGIDFKTGTSNLEIKDAGKLENALKEQPDQVRNLFGSKPDGLVARIDSYINKITGSGGTLTTQAESLTKQNSRIDEQIAAVERRLAQQKSMLESSFIRMEEMQSTINNQLAQLSNAFGTSSSKK